MSLYSILKSHFRFQSGSGSCGAIPMSTLALTCLLLCAFAVPTRAYIPGQSMIWGINGHPTGTNYSSASAATVLSQLKAMHMTYYRIDTTVDTSGAVTVNPTLFNALYAAAPSYGVKLLCMIYAPYNLSNTWQQNYTDGYNTTYNFCKSYPNVVAIEEGNELDDHSIFYTGANNDDGATVGDYNATNCYLLGGCLSGMYAGAHAATPSVLCSIDCINHDHWGWFQILQNDNVPWDRTAIHWYSSSGSVLNTGGANGLDKFSAFGKKIWVTEVNNDGGSGSGGSAGNAAEVAGMLTMLDDLYYYSNVEAIFAYGLYDDSSGNFGFYSSPTTAKPIVASWTGWAASATGPCSLPIGHRIALKARNTGYYVTENSGNNDYVFANSATSVGLPQEFDVVDSLWQGYGIGQVALWCENTGYYVSEDWRLTGSLTGGLICNWQTGTPGAYESYNVTNIGSGYSALLSQGSGYYVSTNTSQGGMLMAGSATTPSSSSEYLLTDLGIAPYNPYNTVTELGAGGQLTANQSIVSPNNHAKLIMGSDGNLVLYNIENGGYVAEWSTATYGNTGAYLAMQGDGNLVVYSSTGSPLWSSATYGNTNGYLSLSSSGNLAVNTQAGAMVWQTNTAF